MVACKFGMCNTASLKAPARREYENIPENDEKRVFTAFG
jgi:hypothetical protein